jgi:hypothetical protein
VNIASNSLHSSFSFADGCRVILLTSVVEYLRESSLMRNCLNDLDRFAASEVYSFRDALDQPHANIEIRHGLLIQISGPENGIVVEGFHPHLHSFLAERGIPKSDITARLGFIEFDGRAFLQLEECVEAFAHWAEIETTPEDLPFMRHPIIREFLNIFARHGKSAKEPTQGIVQSLFTPQNKAWRIRATTEELLPGSIQIQRPQLASALYHLTQYGAIPRAAYESIFRSAIMGITAQALRNPLVVYDLSTENKILTPEVFADLLAATETTEVYDQARNIAQTQKLQAVISAQKKLPNYETYSVIADRLARDPLTL